MNSYVARTRLVVVDLDIGAGPPAARTAYCPLNPGNSIYLLYRFKNETRWILAQPRWAMRGILVLVMVTMTMSLYVRFSWERQAIEALLELRDAIGEWDHHEVMNPPKLSPPPYDFLYIDRDSVDSLYSQIDEIALESVTHESASGFGTQVGATIGLLDGQITTDDTIRDTTAQSVIRSNTHERKTAVLINYSVTTSRAIHYQESGAWIVPKLVAPVREFAKITADEFFSLSNPEGSDERWTKATEAAKEIKSRDFVAELSAELAQLKGLVLIDGQFERQRSMGRSILVHYMFPPGPHRARAVFRITVEDSEVQFNKALTTNGELHIRVFGRVVSPSVDGVAVMPIAIF